nr:amidotransferase [uncultured bacterium]
MSGIVGWIDYRRDLSRAAPVVRAMAATMAARGPDGEGVWTSRHAALGHRRLEVSGYDHVDQPFVFEVDGQVVATAVFSGNLDNLAELRTVLASTGRRLRDGGEAEIVLHGYLEWGRDCVSRMAGVFAFAVWDARARELFLGRDRLGLKPLYYYELPHGILFASEQKALIAHPLVTPELDREGLAELLTYAGTPDHGVLRGFRKLRGGHVAVVRESGVSRSRYWQLSAYHHDTDLAATVERTRELLLDAVRAQSRAAAPTGFLLSGGLDSSVVVGLAAKAGAGTPLRTYTVTFAGYDEQFRPDFVRGTPDGPYVRALVEFVGAEHRDIVLATADLLDPVARTSALRAKDLPSMLGDMNTSLYLLCLAAGDHVKVALSGETADSVFGGNVYGAEETGGTAGRTFPWVRFHEKHAGHHAMGGGLFSRDLLARLDLVEYGADRCQESFAETPQPDDVDPVERRARQDTYLQLTRWADSQLAHSERNAMAAGLDVRMPFADHRLVDYVFNVPWQLKSFDGKGKSLLRAAAEGIVPDTVLNRPKSPFPVSIDPAYQRVLHEELSRVANDPASPAAPLLELATVRERLATPEALAGSWVARTDVEMVLAFDQWLREYGVRLTC